MPYPDVARDLDRVSGFIEAVPADPNAEGGEIGRGFCRQCGDQAGIEAARQKDTDRHIGDDALANRGRKQLVQPIDRLFLAVSDVSDRLHRRPPIALDMNVAVVGREDASGFELGYAMPSRHGSGQVFV